MPYQMFQVTDVNPNDTTGGGGCICDPEKQIDCKPPYAVFVGNDMESIASPHVVVCRGCAAAVLEAMNGEILAAGERHSGPDVVNPVAAPEELPDI